VGMEVKKVLIWFDFVFFIFSLFFGSIYWLCVSDKVRRRR
jgi:hypothetical protein